MRKCVGVLVFSLLVGCGSNVGYIKAAPPVEAPASQIYKSNLDKVWSSALNALAQDETIKMSDKNTGLIVTELRSVQGKELSLFKTYFLGKTFKYSYTVRMENVPSSTKVTINVKLSQDQLFFAKRETNDQQIEAYLRKDLFDKIAKGLEPSGK